jgi:outer membrane protein assembly factor BamD (BamD/ComL family)
MGVKFHNDKKYDEALKEFQSTVDSYPKSRVADAALLRIAEHQLDVAGDTAAAQAAVDRLLKDYEQTDSGPMAYVLAGRIILVKGRTPPDVAAALAKYERVRGLFAGSDAVPASIYFAGEAYRLTHRDEQAISSYQQVSADYPESEWAQKAMLGEAQCLVLTGKAIRAMDVLQRVRQRFPTKPEAATAAAWNTILYRLYLRASTQPAFQYVAQKSIPRTASLIKDIKAMAISPTTGWLYAATPDAVVVFDLAGKPEPNLTGRDVRAIAFDRANRPVLICREAVVSPAISNRPLSVKKPDGTFRVLNDVASGVLTSGGDLLVVDSNLKNIGRFSPTGSYLGPFAQVFSDRLAIDVTGRVASIDQDGSGVSILDHEGQKKPQILSRGKAYEFKRPMDIAFDSLGHVYVLDRNAATVWIFAQSPQPQLLASFSIPPKSPGVFRGAVCLAIDSAGRLYIYDDGVEKIQVYQ